MMSCNIDVELKLNIHTAALIRESLFRYTKDDSYEYPAPRVVEIRSVIQQLDELIEANLPEDHDH